MKGQSLGTSQAGMGTGKQTYGGGFTYGGSSRDGSGDNREQRSQHAQGHAGGGLGASSLQSSANAMARRALMESS